MLSSLCPLGCLAGLRGVTMNLNKCLNQAENMAMKAKPWILKQNDKTYTAVFNMNQWVYEVFEEGVFLMNINTKSPAKAKQFLKAWLVS